MLRWSLDLRKVRKLLLQRHEETLPRFSVIRQPTDMVCWATCYKMVDNWRKAAPSSGWCHYVRCSAAQSPSCQIPQECCNRPRRTAAVRDDWIALGYKKVAYKGAPYTLDEVRQAIGNGHPVMAFLSRPGHSVGHFVLIVGTGRATKTQDNTYILADPMTENLAQVGVTDMPYKAFWKESWRVEW